MPFHPRNKYQGFYDFKQILDNCPDIQPFILIKKDGNWSLDFGQPVAVYLLNKTLLATQYCIKNWTLPEGALCPPIPNRVDYLHHLADLLSYDKSTPPYGKKTKILDIGTGASCIYPILGTAVYSWSFVGVDSHVTSIKWAHDFLAKNNRLRNLVQLRWQRQPQHVLKGIIKKQDKFEASICNPPFYRSAAEALAQQQRKWRQLHPEQPSPNFGGQAHELYCTGGEMAFIKKMILESQLFKHQIRWFTTLVSQEKHLKHLHQTLKTVKVKQVEIINLQHGNKKSRVLCWTY